MADVVFRTPCTFHENCDETSVGLLHRSSKEGQPRPDEKQCMVCEGVLEEAKIALRTKGSWKCPVCGVVTTADEKTHTITPMLSKWYSAINIGKK